MGRGGKGKSPLRASPTPAIAGYGLSLSPRRLVKPGIGWRFSLTLHPKKRRKNRLILIATSVGARQKHYTYHGESRGFVRIRSKEELAWNKNVYRLRPRWLPPLCFSRQPRQRRISRRKRLRRLPATVAQLDLFRFEGTWYELARIPIRSRGTG